MRCFIVFFSCIALSFFAFADNDHSPEDNTSTVVVSDDCLLKGKVKIVDSYEDIKVKIVEDYPDLEVTVVDGYVGNECGRIMLVKDYEDIKVKIVDSYADITIRFKDKRSKELFFKQLKQPK
ncbi:MAG: hypothetical protein ACTTJH_00670 [Bacteroidales bacterium]